jgi:trehalose synthase
VTDLTDTARRAWDREAARAPMVLRRGAPIHRSRSRRATEPFEVRIAPLPLERLQPVATPEGWEQLQADLRLTKPLLAGRRIWLVNSTAVGGGVAEMIRSLMPYGLGAGLDMRWLVIGGSPPFFAVTKELHNQLHGHARRRLDEDARAIYESTLSENAAELVRRMTRGDVVILHDPQTAALVEPLRDAGAIVIWRSHIGTDSITSVTGEAWEFLLPYVSDADAFVFSREQFVPAGLRDGRVHVIAPSIDPTSTKNGFMPMTSVEAILEHVGIVRARHESWEFPRFVRRDGVSQVVKRRAEVLQYGPAPRLDVDPLVLHLSRWDRLKDPVGVMRGFVKHVLSEVDAYLVMAGPAPGAVADDPEAVEVFEEVVRAWRALPYRRRSRIRLALLPMDDLDENAAIVNALQRASSVVVKKSLEEGFGLGVTEAMWKRLPVVASRVGGIQEQIEHRRSGLLIDDPRDLEAFGAAVREALGDRDEARRCGAAAERRVRERFLHDRHLAEWLELVAAEVLERDGAKTSARTRVSSPAPVHADSVR